jgi:hypothetical protein
VLWRFATSFDSRLSLSYFFRGARMGSFMPLLALSNSFTVFAPTFAFPVGV